MGPRDHDPATTGSRGAAGPVLVVARMSALDLLRRPGTWTVTFLTGLLFAVLFAGLGFTTDRTQERAERISFMIAVDGDLEGGARFVEQLSTSRLVVRPFANAADAVTTARASAGLTIPPDLDARLAAGEVSDIDYFYRAAHNTSQEALNTLLLRVQDLERAAIEARVSTPGSMAGPAAAATGTTTATAASTNTTTPSTTTSTTTTVTAPVGGAASPVPVELAVHEVRQDPRVNRNQFAASLAAMACVLCLGTISSVTGVFGRSQEQRTLEPMLLLPLSRTALTAGLAAGAFPVAVLQLITAQAVVLATTALPVEGLQQPPGEVARMMVLGVGAAILLGALATGTGCLAGTIGVGTDDAVSLGDFLGLPFIAIGIVLFLSPDLPATPPTALLPIVGPALALRDGIRGTLAIPFAVGTVVATAAWLALAVQIAGRLTGAERRLLRATR